MKIGVIGLGMVGEAVSHGMRWIGHEVVGFDVDPKKQATMFDKILHTELVFVCVPTPVGSNVGECDTSKVWSVVADLNFAGYRGLIVVKSTITPGTTVNMQRTFPKTRLVFCPEFLRERARFTDFIENHELCVVGTPMHNNWSLDDRQWVHDEGLVIKAHGSLPKSVATMTSTEAELLKYFVNCFNAQRIVFANAFYDVCKTLGASYDTIRDAATKRSGIVPDYLACNEQTRWFGGACLPKDTMAFAAFVKSLNLCTDVFSDIVKENSRLMRGLVTNLDTNRRAGVA
jgi:UDPglucose 6-dehydrogenase